MSKESEWHKNEKNNFEHQEVSFPIINDSQIENRRADVYLPQLDTIIEFQHSKISSIEVENRINDYSLHNIQIIWIIDGNNEVNVLKKGDVKCLEFKVKWKYNRFKSCSFIYIEQYNILYKINPNNVKSDKIIVSQVFYKDDVYKSLKENEYIFTSSIEDVKQCSIKVKNWGAGSGKTYGLINNVKSEIFEYYDTIIVISQLHSAKHIIFEEFKKMYNQNKDIFESDVNNYEPKNKKYTIPYKTIKTNKEHKLIFGTVDSFMYSLGDKNHNHYDKFYGYVLSILHDKSTIKNTNNYINYGYNLQLSNKICLMIDEAQDLNQDYIKAIQNIIEDTYIDVYIVGDILQSLRYENNGLKYLIDNREDFNNIDICIQDFTNATWRFKDINLINFVNNLIDFNKYGLYKISITKENTPTDNKDSLILFTGKTIFANETDDIKLNEEVEIIMNYYKNEVIINNREPNDFLIITAFTKKNPLIETINTEIQKFWIDRKNDNTEYNCYSIFHKSEIGESIDLSTSNNATRIVSIHTSKGDGRKVVFVIGISEQALIKFSQVPNNIIYDSLLHVAITRMKEKLYFRYELNNDDICKRINKYKIDCNYYNDDNNIDIDYFNISSEIKFNIFVDMLKNNNDYQELTTNVFNHTQYTTFSDNTTENQIIDMSHHKFRYATMLIYFMNLIIKDQKNKEVKKQIYAKYQEIIKAGKPLELFKMSDYNDYIKDYYKCSKDTKKHIVILNFKKEGEIYNEYYKIIYRIIEHIQTKLKNNIDDLNFCPLECLLVYFIIQQLKNGIYSEISIKDLYDIIHIYNKTFTKSIKGHKKCLCKKLFNKTNNNTNIKSDRLYDYLIKHYNDVEKLTRLYNDFLLDYSNISYLMDHRIYIKNNDNFSFNKFFKFIGYTENTVFIFYLKPQFNSINYNEFLIDSIYDAYLFYIFNNKSNINNYNKFYNKDVVSIVLSLDTDKYQEFRWMPCIREYNTILTNCITNKITNYYITECASFYKYIINMISINKETNYNFNKILNIIIKQLIEYNKNFPSFIKDVLQDSSIRNNKYSELNNDEFNNLIKLKLDLSIEQYFDD